MKPRGRFLQDHSFSINEFNGNKLRQLIGAVDVNEPDDHPLMLFLKTDSVFWQRFCLDAGLSIWEELDKETAFYDFTDCKKIDYGAQFDIINGTIINIKSSLSNDKKASQIEIELENGKVILAPYNFEQDDSDSKISFELNERNIPK